MTLSVSREQASFQTSDGRTLAGVWFVPPEPRSLVVLHGATAVPCRYYGHFARWLADQSSAAVLVYDYRDTGLSLTGSIRASKATMGDWAVYDQAAALAEALRRFPGLSLDVIGHSLGGIGLPFHDDAPKVRKLIAVASGPANWREHPLSYTPLVLLFWFALGPFSTALAGFTPGKLIGLGADLPAGAYWQWRRWCLSEGFHRTDWGTHVPMPDLERYRGHVRLVGISDDVMIPPPVVLKLAQFYPKATIEPTTITPSEFGVKRIGHISVFSQANKAAWPKLVP